MLTERGKMVQHFLVLVSVTQGWLICGRDGCSLRRKEVTGMTAVEAEASRQHWSRSDADVRVIGFNDPIPA